MSKSFEGNGFRRGRDDESRISAKRAYLRQRGDRMASDRVILHVDMDQFYAAVEEREHPEYRGKPVVVGADPKEGAGRGVVSTCNYEARKFGIKSGMPISRAWKLCPDAIYVRPNFKLYIDVSSRIMAIFKRYADKFEAWGLDEAFIEVSSKVSDFGEAKRLAATIKSKIYGEEGLRCSIGVASNKLVAKIASDHEKPDGLTVVEGKEAERFLAPLPVRRLLWVGRKTERKLHKLGIETIGDLAAFEVSTLTKKFGVMGEYYHLAARGIDESEVSETGVVKSVGREVTFDVDTAKSTKVLETVDQLSRTIHDELVDRGFFFKTVTVKIRYENFQTHTHGNTLPLFAGDLRTLRKMARALVRPHLDEQRKIRLIGVRASNFISRKHQKTLH
jgi:DNA polymerase IV (DinB-like DNA polymerase)